MEASVAPRQRLHEGDDTRGRRRCRLRPRQEQAFARHRARTPPVAGPPKLPSSTRPHRQHLQRSTAATTVTSPAASALKAEGRQQTSTTAPPPPQHASPSSSAFPPRHRRPKHIRQRIWSGTQIHGLLPPPTTMDGSSTREHDEGPPNGSTTRENDEGEAEAAAGRGRRPDRHAQVSTSATAPAAQGATAANLHAPRLWRRGPPPPRSAPAAAAAGRAPGIELVAAR